MKDPFDLDRVIYRFDGDYPFTIRDGSEGVQIFGGIGSGKTSGSGAALAKAYLHAGFGGLVLCAKKSECALWQGYAKETGRSDSLLIFDDSGEWVFNFLQYEVSRQGEGAGNTENLVRIFITVQDAISRSSGNNMADPYWSGAMRQLMRNAIDLCLIARGEVSIPLMHQIVRSAPQSIEERDSPEWWEKSLCAQLLTECQTKTLDKWTDHDLEATAGYWLGEFPSISSRTRSGIISMFTSIADIFLRRPFRMLFSESPDDPKKIAYPELCQHGAIVILNLPVKEFAEAGRGAAVLYKTIWQQAMERRNVQENSRPVFLWADEAQNFITDYDAHFQATARSSRACTVYLTQNLPNYFAELGNRDRVHSLVGNLQLKVFHANSDPETNQYAADVIGKSWQTRRGESQSIGMQQFSMGDSQQESLEWDVIPQTFSRLAKGGPANNCQVQGIVFQNGRTWKNNNTYLFSTFKQSSL